MSILKKALHFAASFLAAFLLFSMLFFVFFEIATYKRLDVTNNEQTKKESEAKEKEKLSFLSIYIDKDKIFIAEIIIKQSEIRAIPLNVNNKEKIYKEQGLYPLVTACEKVSSNYSKQFLKINSESFVTITDRIENLVYNDDNGNEVLLTGKQANDILTEQNFADICKKLTESVLKSNTKDKFLFVANESENNLSYPFLYDWVYD